MPAFLILSHRSQQAVSDLFRYLYEPACRYYLHIDAKAPIGLHRLANGLAAAFNHVELVPSRLCSWGGYSLIAATRDAITQALAHPGFGHFIIVSDQHLPLIPASHIAASLTPGISDIQMMPARMLVAAGQADIADRLAWHYRELAGVGMFATTPRRDAPALEIHHGSQWMILDEALCRTIATAPPEIWDFFATTLLADEIALQTISGMACAEISGHNRTWVATPERIGDHSMIFAAQHFFQAKTEGYLFIRKRPDDLPDDVRAALESHATFRAAELAEILSHHRVDLPATKPPVSPAELVLHLRWDLNRLAPDLVIEALAPPVNAPACYITLRDPAAPADITLSLLSEDLVHFKILLARHQDFTGDFTPAADHGWPASIIRARIWGLAYQRELHIPGTPEQGFVEVPDPANLSPLIAALRVYLAAAANLTRQAS